MQTPANRISLKTRCLLVYLNAYLSNSIRRPTCLKSQRKQVEGHMRVCLEIDAAFESMETASPSEPILSEAAYVIMARKSFGPLESLKSVLEGFSVHKGDRGEFLALLLLARFP